MTNLFSFNAVKGIISYYFENKLFHKRYSSNLGIGDTFFNLIILKSINTIFKKKFQTGMVLELV